MKTAVTIEGTKIKIMVVNYKNGKRADTDIDYKTTVVDGRKVDWRAVNEKIWDLTEVVK